MREKTVLIIDDDDAILTLLTRMVRRLGFQARGTASVDELVRIMDESEPSLIIIDLQMPQHDGIEVLDRLAMNSVSVPIAVTSGFGDRVLNSARQYAASRGLTVAGTLPKPIKFEVLRHLLDTLRDKAKEVDADALRQAVREKELTIHYQPKISLSRESLGEVVGFEALLRWIHPDFGLLPPDRFITLAEEHGLISEITEKVVATATEQVLNWNIQGSDKTIAINLSATTIADRAMGSRLCGIVRESGLDPRLVIFEVTEGAAMQSVRKAMETLMRLRLCGFDLAIDDFGTGYSSLGKLYRMPYTELKIDRSFVQPLGTADNDARVIVNAVVDLAHNLSLKVCAEGVESIDACRFLYRLGCETMQGFLASPGLAPDEMTTWLRQWQPDEFRRSILDAGVDTAGTAQRRVCSSA